MTAGPPQAGGPGGVAPRAPRGPRLGREALWGLLLALSQLGSGAAANLTVAVVLPARNTTYPWAWPRVGPAVRLAVAEINARPGLLLPGYALRLVFGTSEDDQGLCSDSVAPLSAVDLKMNHHPDAFLGPGCIYSAAPVARFTQHWGLPLVTAGAEAVDFDNKGHEYALTTRTGPSHGKLGSFAAALNLHFNWTSRALLLYWDHKKDERPCYFAVEGLYMKLRAMNNMTVEDIPFSDTNYTALVQHIQQKARSKSRLPF